MNLSQYIKSSNDNILNVCYPGKNTFLLFAPPRILTPRLRRSLLPHLKKRSLLPGSHQSRSKRRLTFPLPKFKIRKKELPFPAASASWRWAARRATGRRSVSTSGRPTPAWPCGGRRTTASRSSPMTRGTSPPLPASPSRTPGVSSATRPWTRPPRTPSIPSLVKTRSDLHLLVHLFFSCSYVRYSSSFPGRWFRVQIPTMDRFLFGDSFCCSCCLQ